MVDSSRDTSWKSRLVKTCGRLYAPKWWILFFGVLIAVVGFSIATLMELTVTSKIISFLAGVTGACFIVFALTFFKESEQSEGPRLELRGNTFYLNGREAGTPEINRAIRRDPTIWTQFWEAHSRDHYTRAPLANNLGLTDTFKQTCSEGSSKCLDWNEHLEDTKSVASDVSQITVLEDWTET